MERNGFDLSIGVERPAVIAAPEMPRVALGFIAHHGAPVAAAVEEDIDLAIFVPRQHDRLAPDPRGQEVTDLRDLRSVADINPGPGVNPLHLQLEDRLVQVDAPMHPVRLHQLPNMPHPAPVPYVVTVKKFSFSFRS